MTVTGGATSQASTLPGLTSARQSKVLVSSNQTSVRSRAPRTEIFFLHLDEGYFGCQVNESADVLQIYDVSKLCDGVTDCFLGSDENRAKLKCSGKSYEIYNCCNDSTQSDSL